MYNKHGLQHYNLTYKNLERQLDRSFIAIAVLFFYELTLTDSRKFCRHYFQNLQILTAPVLHLVSCLQWILETVTRPADMKPFLYIKHLRTTKAYKGLEKLGFEQCNQPASSYRRTARQQSNTKKTLTNVSIAFRALKFFSILQLKITRLGNRNFYIL